MSLIRGVQLAGRFLTHHQLNSMSPDQQRNNLIVVLSNLSNQGVPHYQGLDDERLAGAGAVMAFQRAARIRTDQELTAMSDDDQRNTLIVEIGQQTGMGRELQGLSNIDLVLLGLGKRVPGSLDADRYIRGVLLGGGFRSQHELNTMSRDDHRNTLIVELAGHSKQPVSDFQAMNDAVLAGVGAVMVFLRGAGIRDDAALRTMSADDQRNTLIVEIDGQTHLGSRLQALDNMDLVLTGLGVEPSFPAAKPRSYVFSIDSVEIRKQKADNDHSDSDWLTIVVTVGNPTTKDVQTLPSKTHHIEGNIKTGDVIAGTFATDPFVAAESDVVVVTYVLTNLGSSDAEEQFAQAVKVTNKVVAIVGPIVGAAIGFFMGVPTEGLQMGTQVSKALDVAISTLSDVFDFLGIHAGPPNCNGVVLNDVVTYLPGELERAVGQRSSRDYVGTQEEERCGGAPESRVNFTVTHFPPDGLVAPNP